MALSKIATDLLSSFAPTLLMSLALPPPFKQLASAVVAATLGRFSVNNAPADAAQAGQADPALAKPADPAAPPPKPKIMEPAEVEDLVERNASNPEFILALKQAEIDLQKYETEAGLRFAELSTKDRERAGNFQISAGLAPNIFKSGIRLVWTAMIGMLIMIITLLLLALGAVKVEQTQLTVAAFGLIGTAVGFVNGIAGTIVAFYYGSSQGSKEKSDTITELSTELGKAALKSGPAPAAVVLAPPTPAPAPGSGDAGGAPSTKTAMEAASLPATPMSSNVLLELVPELTTPHSKFPDSVSWALTAQGISIEGAAPVGSPGEPSTVRTIWSKYGNLCTDWAKRYGVPVELIVATIATESGGRADARRQEPQIGDESVGLMQTLVKTAQGALGRQISANDLLQPSLSIEAGTAYIASQRANTHLDPPLVAAAYNAGSVRLDPAQSNRWKLRCFPIGTGRHVDNFVAWFADAMRVSAEQKWGADPNVPSFASALAAKPGPRSELTRTSLALPATGSAIRLLKQFSGAVPLSELASQDDLAREVQQRLSELGYLDPPPDGNFGPVSGWALDTFCKLNGLQLKNEFSRTIAEALANPKALLPDVPKADAWFNSVIAYMNSKNYWICRAPDCRNIVYLEGVNEDGTLNQDTPNQFNDLRIVFWIDSAGVLSIEKWKATTEPGKFWTQNPMNFGGAARIAFDQYKSWIVGTHMNGKASAHEALVQIAPVTVYRDLNKDYQRTGDKTDTGLFGINQHAGHDAPVSDLGKTSAGCLVGQTNTGHRAFMKRLKEDPRFQASSSYRFMTAVLPGDEVL